LIGILGKDCGTIKPANVISTSYGYNEADLTPAYATRQCAEYAKLGLMGVTVLFSSGDQGVAGNGGLCLNPDGIQSDSGNRFNPTFPSTCPYVTSIGATQGTAMFYLSNNSAIMCGFLVIPGSTVFQPESACEKVIYSGGGFSNYFKMPGYQTSAVNRYLKENPPPYPDGTYNTSGSRAYPDLSANGANYAVSVSRLATVWMTCCRCFNAQRQVVIFPSYTVHRPVHPSLELS
jgi:tripeptidyl-peptidase I